MSSFRTFQAKTSLLAKKLFKRSEVHELLPATGSKLTEQEAEELFRFADQFPSMGGKQIGPFLRDLARNAPPNTAIVEVGSWLGAGTAQLAAGVRLRGDGPSVSIFSYDRWIASKSEIVKAEKAQARFQEGEDTLPWVRERLARFGVPITFVKGDIGAISWNGQPVSVYVDDAAKSPKYFYSVLRTFGPSWIPGVTVLVLMDYHYWEKTGSEDHKCQKFFIEGHADYFSPVEGFRRGSNAAFIYNKELDFDQLTVESLLRPSSVS